MSWLVQLAIGDWLESIVEQAINLFIQFLVAINSMAGDVLQLAVVKNAIVYSQGLAGTILITKVAYEAWMTYIMRMNGDPDADPGGLLIRSTASAAMIGGMPWLVKWLYEFGTAVSNDIAKLPGVDFESASSPMEKLLDMVVANQSYKFFTFIGVIFAVLIFIVVLIQSFIRAAELAVGAVVGCFMALSLTNTSSQAFGSWFREMMALCMTQAVQVFLIKVSFFTLTVFKYDNLPLFNLFLFCGFLYVTYKSPSILKSYIHSTGVGKMMGGAAQSAGSMLMMRRFFTKGV
jgi:hypothetical protein